MRTERYEILLSLKVSGGEKGLSKHQLEKILPKNISIIDEMHVVTTTVPMYTYKEEGTKEFDKEVLKTIRPFVSYVFDNLNRFIEIHQDKTFEPLVEYVEHRDSNSVFRSYGVGCLTPYVLEISKGR